MAGKGAKPGERRGGRQKGTPNKFSGELKEMILNALSAAGGQQYLEEQANKNPTAFMTLIGKVLPLSVTGQGENGSLVIEIVKHAHSDTE